MLPPVHDKSILLVEDDFHVRQAMTRALEQEGYIIHQAEHGEVGLHILESVIPDLILSDVRMPCLDGINFYKRVRSNPLWLKIPFVFLTGQSTRTEIQVGRELGADDFIIKPIDLSELSRIINARLLRATELQLAYVGQAYSDTISVLANILEGRDPYTHGHVERVTLYARWLAEALGWPSAQLRTLEFGAQLHDIGKIIIPDHILKKEGPLTSEERALMRQHPEAGVKIVREIHFLENTIPYILYHHEKWDGTGYPGGYKAENIPIEGRLLAIVDVFDALTSARPYRLARRVSEVIQFLHENAGTHFDPELVPVFLNVIENKMQGETLHFASNQLVY